MQPYICRRIPSFDTSREISPSVQTRERERDHHEAALHHATSARPSSGQPAAPASRFAKPRCAGAPARASRPCSRRRPARFPRRTRRWPHGERPEVPGARLVQARWLWLGVGFWRRIRRRIEQWLQHWLQYGLERRLQHGQQHRIQQWIQYGQQHRIQQWIQYGR